MKRAFPLLVLGLMACSTKDGNGVLTTELRDLDSFEAVRNNSSLPMLVEVGPEYAVEVSCDENLLSDIETILRGDTLELSQPADLVLNPSATCEVWVAMPAITRAQGSSNGDLMVEGDLAGLNYLRNSGWGDMTIAGVDSAQLRVISQSRGRMLLSGLADVTSLESSGAGGIESGELIVANANIVNRGAGDITATVTEQATVLIEGDGDVVLHGDPDVVEVDDDGCGDVY